MYQPILTLLLLLLAPFWVVGNTIDGPESETLIVFTQVSTDQHFIETCLQQIKNYAKAQELNLVLKSAEEGLPKEITSTPAIIYQNARGRQLYAARYTSFSSIRNFIRTSRSLPPVAALNCKADQFALQLGRTTIMAPIKLTPLQGVRPKAHQAAEFQTMALQAIEEGFQQFCQLAEVCLEKSDRAFYMDFHPYRDAQGGCYLSLALYSPFSCISPIYESEAGQLQIAADQWPQLFAQAAQLLEAELLRQLRSSTIGDALSPVATTIPVKSWEELGLALPEDSSNSPIQDFSAIELPKRWKYSGPVAKDIPVLQFRFQAPLDRYAGEVAELDGQLQLDTQNKLSSGQFEVNTQSLTMGMADLDEKVLKKYIKAFRYPKASFHFEQLEGLRALVPGQATSVYLQGQFQLMKYQQPINVNATLIPLLNEQGQVQLNVEAQFELRITRDFNIEGPDGPSPANETMLFYLNFMMISH